MYSFKKDFVRKYICVANQLETRGYDIVYSGTNGVKSFRLGGRYTFRSSSGNKKYAINPLYGLAENRIIVSNIDTSVGKMFNVHYDLIGYFSSAVQLGEYDKIFKERNREVIPALHLGLFIRENIFNKNSDLFSIEILEKNFDFDFVNFKKGSKC